MIDIMAICQSYERQELLEIRWIAGLDNLADAMTKTCEKYNSVLETLVSTNRLTIKVKGQVQQAEMSVNNVKKKQGA